jgi:hypothetical protein
MLLRVGIEDGQGPSMAQSNAFAIHVPLCELNALRPSKLGISFDASNCSTLSRFRSHSIFAASSCNRLLA